MQDIAISALAQAMLEGRKTGFLVWRHTDRRSLARQLKRHETDFRILAGSPADAERSAGELVAAGCDLIVLWQTALSLQGFVESGELVMPTRIIDAESGEKFDTALPAMGRRDRAALLSSEALISDPGTRKRMAMRFQCVVLDRLGATLTRFAQRAGIPFFVVCTHIDRRADRWTNRILAWQLRFGSRTLLSTLAWALFKPRELMVSYSSRSEARTALRDAGILLRECLEEDSLVDGR